MYIYFLIGIYFSSHYNSLYCFDIISNPVQNNFKHLRYLCFIYKTFVTIKNAYKCFVVFYSRKQ